MPEMPASRTIPELLDELATRFPDREALVGGTQRYTYVVWTETGEQELYDRRLDPYELQNVASDPAYAAIKARLAADRVRLNGCAGVACNVSP